MKEIINSKYKIFFLTGLGLTIICAWFSTGFYHPDERFQVLEFCNFKMGDSSARLPWEFYLRVRATLLPDIAYVFAKIMDWCGFYNESILSFLLRLFTGIITWFITCRFCLLLLPKFKAPKAQELFILMSLFLWFIPYLTVRFTVENIAGVTFLYGIYSILSINKKTTNTLIRYLIAGLLFGMSFFIRLQMAFAVAGFVAWLIWVRKIKWKYLFAIAFSSAVAIGINFLLDSWFYGEWTFAPFNYIHEFYYNNTARHGIADFGANPWWFYFSEFIMKVIPPLSVLLLIMFFAGVYKNLKDPFIWVILPFLVFHCIVVHKELRFLFPVTFIFIYITTLGFDYFLTKDYYKKIHKYIYWALIIICVPLLLYRTFIPAPFSLQQKTIAPPEIALSIYYNKHGMHDSAMKYYRLSYEKDKTTSLAPVNNYIVMLMQDKDTDKVVPVCEDAISLYPDYLQGFYVLFSIYEKRKQYDKIYDLSKLFVKTYDRNPTHVLKSPNGKNTLIFSIDHLYNGSLMRNDTATNHDALKRMKELNIKLPANIKSKPLIKQG